MLHATDAQSLPMPYRTPRLTPGCHVTYFQPVALGRSQEEGKMTTAYPTKSLFTRRSPTQMQIIPERIMFSGVTVAVERAQSTKIFQWGPQQVGDCTLQAPMLELRTNGFFTFSGNLSSSGDDDSWGILHFDFKQANGLVLWSSGQFWSPTIGDWAPWIIDAAYPQHLFDTINIAQFFSHC